MKAYFTTAPTFTTTTKRDDKGVELYAGRRFFAFTGKPFGRVVPIADCTAAARGLADVLRPPSPPRPARPPAPPSGSALARLRACEPIRERASISGGTVYTLAVCPFTGERHAGGGPYAVVFPDGAVWFCCERSCHGARRELMQPNHHERVIPDTGQRAAAHVTAERS